LPPVGWSASGALATAPISNDCSTELKVGPLPVSAITSKFVCGNWPGAVSIPIGCQAAYWTDVGDNEWTGVMLKCVVSGPIWSEIGLLEVRTLVLSINMYSAPVKFSAGREWQMPSAVLEFF